MQYSTRTADAVHILVLIALHEGNLSSQALAKSTASSPAHIRKLMSQLRNGGLLSSCRGKAAHSVIFRCTFVPPVFLSRESGSGPFEGTRRDLAAGHLPDHGTRNAAAPSGYPHQS
ncbi:Rrf2 family transcriptional regulator [Faecalibaculum rodentium]|uniref:Rrf2 family transcriptional regulator n=1 Tax=Faecalibaculum rodentium TaxID=1702221 RepID=UPI0032E8EA75